MPYLRTTRVTALLAALTAVTVAGCSGSSKPAPPSPSSSKPRTTSTTTTTSAAVTSSGGYNGPASVPIAARAHTDAGRIAFAKHYVNLINETSQKPTVGVLEPLSLPGCKSCANYIATVKELKAADERFVGDSYKIKRTSFPEALNHNAVEVFCTSPEGKHVSLDGKLLQVFPAKANAAIVIFLKWSGAWLVAEIKNDDGAGSM